MKGNPKWWKVEPIGQIVERQKARGKPVPFPEAIPQSAETVISKHEEKGVRSNVLVNLLQYVPKLRKSFVCVAKDYRTKNGVLFLQTSKI